MVVIRYFYRTIQKGRFPQNCMQPNLYFKPTEMQFFGMTKFYYTTPKYVIPFYLREIYLWWQVGGVTRLARYAIEDTAAKRLN